MLRREDFMLRPLAKEDLAQVLAWRNSERIRAVMYTDRIITLEEHRGWFERSSRDSGCKHSIVTFKGLPIGLVSLVNIDLVNQRCTWGFYLGEEGLPQGCGTVLGYLALEYVFAVLGLHKLCGEAFAFNIPSLRFHKRLGFVEEGRLERHILKNNQFEDIIVMAMFAENWRQNKKRLEDLCFGGVV